MKWFKRSSLGEPSAHWLGPSPVPGLPLLSHVTTPWNICTSSPWCMGSGSSRAASCSVPGLLPAVLATVVGRAGRVHLGLVVISELWLGYSGNPAPAGSACPRRLQEGSWASADCQAAPGRPSLGGSWGHQAQSSGFTLRTALGPLPRPVRGILGDCWQWGPKPRRSLGRDSALQMADKPLWGVEL